ncbi:MAG: WG repeat-containing protein [Clostridia bacterium]|nr:WG repeat-containing protein [Clostridia bacterium]
MKKQNRFKITSLFLCGVLMVSFAGCKDSTLKATGMYQEQPITMELAVKTNIEFPDDMPNFYFQNGYAVFYDHGDINAPDLPKDTNIWNAIDTQGNRVFEKCYNQLSHFNQDGFAVASVSNEEYKLVNTQGQEVGPYIESENDTYWITPKGLYDQHNITIQNAEHPIAAVSNVYNGLVVFVEQKDTNKQLLGVADENGNIIIPGTIPVFFRTVNYTLLFHEDLVIVNYDGQLAIVKITATKNQNITLQTQMTAIPADHIDWYKKAYRFENGQVVLQYTLKQDSKYFIMNKTGEILQENATPPQPTAPLSPKENLISAGEDMYFYPKGDLYGLMDAKGNEMTDAIYSSVGNFWGEHAWVVPKETPDTAVVINKKGEVIGTFPNQTSARVIGEKTVVIQTGTSGNYRQWLYSITGELLNQESFSSIGYFYNGLALIDQNKKIGLIDETGKIVVTPSLTYDTVVDHYGEDFEKSREYVPKFMDEDACIVPINGYVAVVTIQR